MEQRARSKTILRIVGFEVPTAVVMKFHVLEEHIISIFRVEEQPVEETRVKAGAKQSSAGILLGLLLGPEDGGDMFLRNVG
jgi:hypothetical protein